MTKKYTGRVIEFWTDIKDNDRPYNVNDIFPHPDCSYEVTEKRFKELASKSNKRGLQLIELSEVEEPSDSSETTPVTDEIDFDEYNVTELKELAKEREIEGYSTMKRAELVAALQK